MHRDTSCPAGGQGAAPAGLLRGQIEHAEVAWVLLQQPAAILDGILARGMRQLVDQALHDEGVVAMDRDRGLGWVEIHPMVRYLLGIGRVGEPTDPRRST